MAARTKVVDVAGVDDELGFDIKVFMEDLHMDLFSEAHVRRCRRMPALSREVLDAEEFLGVMRRAKELGADPLTGDIYIKKEGNRVNIMISIAQMRKYAKNTGEYAGDDKEPAFAIDPAAVSPSNPQGIISCTYGVYRFVQGEFRYFTHQVYWDDYVPLVNARPNGNGKWEGELNPASFWAQIPFIMLSKVAEAGALRKAYPELGATYIEEEMKPRAGGPQEPLEAHDLPERQVDRFPAQRPSLVPLAALDGAFKTRLGIKAPTPKPDPKVTDFIHVNWLDGNQLQPIPANQFAELVSAFLLAHISRDPEFVVEWGESNKRAREDFWAVDKTLSKNRDSTKLKGILTDAHGRWQKLIASNSPASTINGVQEMRA